MFKNFRYKFLADRRNYFSLQANFLMWIKLILRENALIWSAFFKKKKLAYTHEIVTFDNILLERDFDKISLLKLTKNDHWSNLNRKHAKQK